jgi:hypothetical protein
MALVGYDSGRYWQEKYTALLDLISEMKEGKLTVLIRKFQPRARVSYRKAQEYAMAAIDNGYLKVISGDRLLDADEAGRELKAGRDVYFQKAFPGTANREKTEIRYDVEKGRHVQMPEEEDENVTKYKLEKRAEKLRRAIDRKLGGI